MDKTDLSGKYDFKLEWSLDAGGQDITSDANGPPLFAALQEQLGLRLDAQKAPAETLVIDRVDRPSAN